MIGHLFIVSIVCVCVAAESLESCFDKPCSLQNGTCFTSGCQRVGYQTVCQISSTSNKLPATKPAMCVQPSTVPGFIDFCKTLLHGTHSAGPQGPSEILDGKFATTSTTDNPSKDETIQELSPGESCFGPTILVSVAIGSVFAGCAITLVLLCFCKIVNPCRTDKRGVTQLQDDSREVWRIRMRSRDLGSTSTAQLLSNASTTDTTGQSPPSPSAQLTTGQSVHPSCRERLPPPVLEPVYTAASESSRDYQSIQCGSDTPYTAHSECSSDYSMGHHCARLMMTSEDMEPGTSHDYSSLKGTRFLKDESADYYPPSNSSYKDYTSLTEDDEERTYHQPVSTRGLNTEAIPTLNSGNVTFHVNELNFPRQGSAAERVSGTSRNTTTSTRNETIADSVFMGNTNSDDLPHEYFILDPVI